jgi:hypothetical protein
LPRATEWDPAPPLKEKIHKHVKEYNSKVDLQSGKRKARKSEVDEERERAGKMSRSRLTERMVSSQLGRRSVSRPRAYMEFVAVH